MNLLKKFEKITCLELILLILGFSLLIVFFFGTTKESFVEERETFVRKTDEDIFDDFYVNVYDNLLLDDAKNQFEVDYIRPDPQTKASILDIGSGTGHHVDLLTNTNTRVIGIDDSSAMIKIAQENFPKLNFRKASVLNTMEFPANTFTHITCLHFTIYYIKDKHLFLENCFRWLKPRGILVLHLVNMNKFDPTLHDATPLNKKSIAPPDLAIDSVINFDIFDYKSKFKLDKNQNANTLRLDIPNATFKETFIFKDSRKARINEHRLYMSSQKSILGAAREVGFVLESQTDMNSIGYNYNYLYTLVKPS